MSEQATAVKAKVRFSGIDIVKILASVFVILVHFFLNTAFYTSIPVDSTEFYTPIMVFWIAYTGVPLFIISTGYLMKNKTLSGKYYLGIIKVLVIYVASSTICILWRMKQYNFKPSAWDFVKGYLHFGHSDYAWYVEFYLILFMLIPFLNLAYNGLKNRGQKLTLVITTFVLLIVGPSFFIGFDTANQIQPIPTYMGKCGLFAYYFLGCYLKEFPPKKHRLLVKIITAALFIGTLAFLTLTSYKETIESEYKVFRSVHFFQYDSYPVYILSAAIFILLFDITFKSKIINKILGFLSSLTLATYLVSYLFDLKFYGPFNVKYPFPDFMLRFRHIFEIVPKSYFCSLAVAAAIQVVYIGAEFGVKCAVKALSKSKDAKENNNETGQIPESDTTDKAQNSGE